MGTVTPTYESVRGAFRGDPLRWVRMGEWRTPELRVELLKRVEEGGGDRPRR